MAEGFGEGFGEGGCGFGENMRLKIVGGGVVVVRDGEDRVVCKEVQFGECFRAGCGGDVSVLFPAQKGCVRGNAYLVIKYVPDIDQAWVRPASESRGSRTQRPAPSRLRLQVRS